MYLFHLMGALKTRSSSHVLTFACICRLAVVEALQAPLAGKSPGVVQTFQTLPCAQVTVARGVGIHVAVTLARPTRPCQAVLPQWVAIETLPASVAARAYW